MKSSSRFNKPAAESPLRDFSEFEQTSSANPPVWCAGDIFCGRISYRWTLTPRRARVRAHSLPASPPPTIVTCSTLSPFGFNRRPARRRKHSSCPFRF